MSEQKSNRTFGSRQVVDTFPQRVGTILSSVEEMLLEKNKAYGDAALAPRRIFSKASSTEQLLVRIDDKLSRIATKGVGYSDEDTLSDLIGYLVLLKIARQNEERGEADPGGGSRGTAITGHNPVAGVGDPTCRSNDTGKSDGPRASSSPVVVAGGSARDGFKIGDVVDVFSVKTIGPCACSSRGPCFNHR